MSRECESKIDGAFSGRESKAVSMGAHEQLALPFDDIEGKEDADA